MEEYTELQRVLLKLHERCEAVEDVSRSNGGMGKRSLRRDWENQVLVQRQSSARERIGSDPRISIQARGA